MDIFGQKWIIIGQNGLFLIQIDPSLDPNRTFIVDIFRKCRNLFKDVLHKNCIFLAEKYFLNECLTLEPLKYSSSHI